MIAPVVASRFRSAITSISGSIASEFDQFFASVNAGFVTLTTAINAIVSVRTGEIRVWGGPIIPVGNVSCDGTAVSRKFYGGLFAVIGTAFGVGDGSTTFNLPNIAGPVAGTIYIIKT